MTEAQRRALELDWPIFGIDIDPEKAEQLTLNDIFGRTVNKVVEIGFGNGDNLVEYARQDPARDFVGIEVHRAGVGHALLQTKELALRNLKVICHDAVEVLGHHLADSSLSEVSPVTPTAPITSPSLLLTNMPPATGMNLPPEAAASALARSSTGRRGRPA